MGGGESGVGAAILGKDKGWEVFLSDSGTLKPQHKATLEAEGIAYEEGGHTPELILNATEVVKSPGIPPYAPLVEQLVAKGIPVISEIEFAGRYTDARMVCITGSNGKTTTTELITHILREAGIDASKAGNVGRSLALQVARDPHDVYVVELSSFQLENMYDFRANVAVMLNITPDHMDRYDHCMQNYINAKFRIIRNMTEQDSFVFWQDDPVIAAQLAHTDTDARLCPFSEERRAESVAWTEGEDDARLVIDATNEPLMMPRADLALNGLHNLYNSMAAGISAQLLKADNKAIMHALADFEGVAHRLEYVATVDGVRYINDSKATNVNSTWYALESMPKATEPNVVLILGGTDKGNDYSEILPLVHEKVKAIVAMGVDNKKIMDYFGPEVPEIRSTGSLDECLKTCRELAKEGDTVLLSPCCASFDLFSSYVDRGNQFKSAILNLKP